jgi:uncharacterized sulfatase
MKMILSLAICIAGSFVSAAVAAPPNIVMMIADDASYHDFGCWGNKEVRTPNIDRLAEQGMRLTQFYAPAAVCSPLRQALLTGMYCVRNGAYPNHTMVYPDVKSLPHYLKSLGYRSICVGKKHFAPAQCFPFDEEIGMIGEGRPGNRNPSNLALLEQFIKKDSNQPFFAYVASNEPHSPWNRGDASVYDADKLTLPPYLADTPETRRAVANYYAEINYLDGQVGAVLDLLEKTGHAEDTLVFFFSEQGSSVPHAKWTLYDAGVRTAVVVRWTGKIKPGSESATLMQYVDVVPTLLDIIGSDPKTYDTGQPDAHGNKGFDGKSFKEALLGKDVKIRDYAYSQHTSRGIIAGPPAYATRMVTDGHWKLIWNIHHDQEFQNTAVNTVFFKSWLAKAEGGDVFAKQQSQRYVKRLEWELYNLKADPWEMTNVAEKPENAEIRGTLKSALEQWMQQQGDLGHETEMKALERQVQGGQE